MSLTDRLKEKKDKENDGLFHPRIPGFVYLLEDLMSGKHKIGKSKDPRMRCRYLSYTANRELRLVHVIRTNDTRQCESFYLNQYADYQIDDRFGVEWFTLPQSAIDEFCSRRKHNFPLILKERRAKYPVTLKGSSLYAVRKRERETGLDLPDFFEEWFKKEYAAELAEYERIYGKDEEE